MGATALTRKNPNPRGDRAHDRWLHPFAHGSLEALCVSFYLSSYKSSERKQPPKGRDDFTDEGSVRAT
jgi:hypothetical protein